MGTFLDRNVFKRISWKQAYVYRRPLTICLFFIIWIAISLKCFVNLKLSLKLNRISFLTKEGVSFNWCVLTLFALQNTEISQFTFPASKNLYFNDFLWDIYPQSVFHLRKKSYWVLGEEMLQANANSIVGSLFNSLHR